MYSSLFAHCTTITYIDLTNFDNSYVVDMRDWFWECTSLKSIELSNLDTSNSIDMWGLFVNCHSLTSLNLSSFNTSKVITLLHMFEECFSLTSIDLSNFDTSKVTEMYHLFTNCYNLEYINIKNFEVAENTSIDEIFTGISENAVICIDPIKTPILFDIAKEKSCVTISCKENWRKVQKKINFDTNTKANICVNDCNITDNKYEYKGKCYLNCPENTSDYNYECYSKEEKCEHNCKSCLINSNYNSNSDFIISSICTTCYDEQFIKYGKCINNCSNGFFYNELDSSIKICKCDLIKCKLCSEESLLKQLCLTCNEEENFYPILNLTNNTNEFIDCYNETIPGYYFDINDKYYKKCYISCSTCKEGGNYTNHNCLTCAIDYIYYLNISDSLNCYQTCPEEYNKLIPEKNLCVNKCSNYLNYKYEFRNTCYKECPYNISEKSEAKNFFCEVKCTKDYPFEKIKTQTCVDDCTISERQNGLCKINYISKDENNKEAEEKVIDNIKEEITKDFNVSNIDKGEDVTIKQKGSTITITTTENQNNDKSYNKTTINLGECEDKIKEEYNISKNKSLYILKIDVNQEGFNIPKIEYEIYYPLFGNALIKLNLTVCKDSKINLSIPMIITESLDKINQSSGYYNDICYTTTSEDGTDISLMDRKKDFVNNNLTICEENCDFISYDNELAKAVCSCKVKTNSSSKISDVIIDKDKLFKSFTNIKNIANIKILNCYKLIFKLEAFKNNYANIIMIIIILQFFVIFIIFCFKDYTYLNIIMNVIEYFKLNSIVKKKFLKKQENKRKKHKKKNKLSSLKKSRNNKLIEINENNHIKKKKKKKTILNNFSLNDNQKNENNDDNMDEREEEEEETPKNKNNNIISIRRLKTINSKKIYTKNNNNNYPDNLTEKQIYKIFLKINKYTDVELNDFSYKKALEFDKRSFLAYYLSLIRMKHLLFFSFWPSFDYNSRIIKAFLFFFNFTLSFFVNALFFNDETMHKIYEEKGSFNFIYNIPQILYSSLISGFINGLIQALALTDSEIIKYKQKAKKKNVKIKKEIINKKIKIKLSLFFLISLILLILFWFYLACFCAVYKNTQIHLIKDTVISFSTSMLTPFVIYFLPGIFRFIAIKAKSKNRILMFKFSKILQLL